MPIPKDSAINDRENHAGIWKNCVQISFSETNNKMENTLYLRYLNFSNILDKKKYSERKPMMAKIF